MAPMHAGESFAFASDWNTRSILTTTFRLAAVTVTVDLPRATSVTPLRHVQLAKKNSRVAPSQQWELASGLERPADGSPGDGGGGSDRTRLRLGRSPLGSEPSADRDRAPQETPANPSR